MKILSGIVLLIVVTLPGEAQSWTSQSIRQGAIDFGIYAGGGTGLIQTLQLYRTANIRFLVAGVRIGPILTPELLHGWQRGNFE